MLLFLREKNPNLLDIQEHCIHKMGKIQTEPKLLFGDDELMLNVLRCHLTY